MLGKLLEKISDAASFTKALFIVLTKELFLPAVFGLTVTALVLLFIHFLITENWAGIAAFVAGAVLFAAGVCLVRSICRNLS